MPLPVTIIGGFLGSGKTTLLDRLLREAQGVRYGVLVNDFAALNIDAELVRDAAPNRIALTNGCVCCTISDDLLASALQLMKSDPKPQHLLIECSGVSDPRAVARALTGELANDLFGIDAMICLVDAANVHALDYETTEQVIDQAAASDLVLLTKCDIAAADDIDTTEQTLRDARPMMQIARIDKASLPLELVTGELTSLSAGRRTSEAEPAVAPSAPAHADRFVSRAWRSPRPLSLEAFKQAVKALAPSVYRAKGVLQFVEQPGRRAIFQLVGSRSEITFAESDEPVSESMVVAIGRATMFDATPFDRLFGAGARRAAGSPLKFSA